MCVCFQRRRVRHNTTYVPDRRVFARKERNLHCDVHVTAESKHTLPPFESINSFWIRRLQRSRRRNKAHGGRFFSQHISMKHEGKHDYVRSMFLGKQNYAFYEHGYVGRNGGIVKLRGYNFRSDFPLLLM